MFEELEPIKNLKNNNNNPPPQKKKRKEKENQSLHSQSRQFEKKYINLLNASHNPGYITPTVIFCCVIAWHDFPF